MGFVDYLYWAIMFFAFISGLLVYKQLDMAARIFCVYIGFSIFTEIVAYYSAIKFRTDFPVYAVYNIIELGFLAMYFNYSIDLFKKLHIGVYIAGVGAVLGACNIIFLQGIKTTNSNFLFFEGFCIIGMCLFAFSRLLLKQGRINLLRDFHFWIVTITLFYWTVTYIYWGLYDIFLVRFAKGLPLFDKIILILNIACYFFIGVVYLLYPKMRLKNE